MIPYRRQRVHLFVRDDGLFIAWIIGCRTILEYMGRLGGGQQIQLVRLRRLRCRARRHRHHAAEDLSRAPFGLLDEVARQFHATGAVLNIPAMLITALVTIVLVIGIKREVWRASTRVIVTVKVAVVLMFIAFCARYVPFPEYWHPFIPKDAGAWPLRYVEASCAARRAPFFAHIGFDARSRRRRRRRAQPAAATCTRGILGSLAVCTVFASRCRWC